MTSVFCCYTAAELLSTTTLTTPGTITRECMTGLFNCYTTVGLQNRGIWSEIYCQIDVRFEYGICKEDLGILLTVAV